MWRDEVNILSYLYQGNKMTEEQFCELDEKKRIFWYHDSKNILENQEMIIKDPQTSTITLQKSIFNFLDDAEKQLQSMPKPDYVFGYPLSEDIRSQDDVRPAFLAISYNRKFDKIKLAVLEAAKEVNFRCEVTGDLGTPGIIMDQVWQGIRKADAVVADVTGKNSNVFYEIGLAHALGKEVIIITQSQETPFDIRSFKHIKYKNDELDQLKKELVIAFRAVSPRYPFDGGAPRF